MMVMAERERARDGLLVIRCQQGEPQAYEELVLSTRAGSTRPSTTSATLTGRF